MIRSRDVLPPMCVRSGPTLPPRPPYLWHTLQRAPTGLKNNRRPASASAGWFECLVPSGEVFGQWLGAWRGRPQAGQTQHSLRFAA